MRRIGAAFLGILLAGCGGEPPPTAEFALPPDSASSDQNGPPEIRSARLTPEEPSREETIRLELDARDPDRDGLDVQVTWIRNGAVLRSGPSLTLPANELYPGDYIRARVRVSDGRSEDVAETGGVTVRNLAPHVTSIRIQPDTLSATDSALALVEAVDPEEDEIEYRFRWIRNGNTIPGQDGPTLEAGLVRRGDEIQVATIAVDADGNEGKEILSAPKRVRNAAPVITSEPPYTLAGPDLYEYKVVASDPDGDKPLRFQLIEGPRGAKIDIITGRLLWEIPRNAVGSHDLEVTVQDPHGGETRQRYTLQVRLEASPAAAQ
jgi:hypothetical protein